MQEELKSHLINLQGLEFIYEKRLFPELEYVFKHALTQEVAYNSLLQKRKKEIHKKIGKSIELIYADRLEDFYEMLVHHYQRGDDREKAVRYMMLAAQKAASKFACGEAMIFCEDALKIMEVLPATRENRKMQSEMEFLMLQLKAITNEISPV
jgi:predicted ATPase